LVWAKRKKCGDMASPACDRSASVSDPRVFFASERTLLAWIRTGLALMALGFVVARFGLFITVLSASPTLVQAHRINHALSSVLGITLVVLGTGILLAALQNHRGYLLTLAPTDIPKLPISWLASFMTASVAVAGLLLAAYLALT
jgi:putative membrane protein